MNWWKLLKAYGYSQLLVLAFFTAVHIRTRRDERRPDDES